MTSRSPCSIPPNLVLSILFATLFIGLLDNQILSLILIEVSQSLRTNVTYIGGTVTVYALAAGFAGLIVMPYADRWGRAQFLKRAVLLFVAASLASALAPHWMVFYTARLVTGLAAGIFSATVIAYAADLFPYEQRGRVMGVLSSSYFAAPILGIPLAAKVVALFGWRYIYGLFAGLAVALWLFMRHYLPELLIPQDQSPPPGVRSIRDLLKDRPRRLGVYASFFISAGTGGFVTYLGPWLRTEFQLTVETVAWIYLVTGAGALGGALVAGLLADRLGKKRVLIAGNLISIGLLGWIAALSYGPWLIVALTLTGLATSFRFGPLQALLTELVPANRRSAYIGTRNSISQLGIAASVFIAGQCYHTPLGFSAIIAISGFMVLVATGIIFWIDEPKFHPKPGVAEFEV